MAVFYFDPQYPAYNAIPTWNVAQDGDGTSKALAVPAIASFTLTGPCSVGDTITIMGVTLTAVASAPTASQFLIGASASVQADNIATAINAATALVNNSFTPTTPQLRDLLYARGPLTWAAADTVEIMTRVGTARWNGLTAISKVSASIPSINQFASGAGGSAGYMANNATIWKSGKTKTTYGLIFSLLAQAGNLAGLAMLADVDVCHVRANGHTMDINIPRTLMQARGTFIVDDGTIWPGDTGTFTISKNATAGQSPCVFTSVGSGSLIFTARNRDKAIFVMTSAAGGEPVWLLIDNYNSSSYFFQIDNFTFQDNNPNAAGVLLLGGQSRALPNQAAAFTRNKFTSVKAQYTLILAGPVRTTSYPGVYFRVSGLDVAFPNFVGTGTRLADVSLVGPGGSSGATIILEDINYTASPSAIAPYIIGASALSPSTFSYGAAVIVRNIKGCKPANNLGFLGTAISPGVYSNSCYISQQNIELLDSRYNKLETNGFVREVSSASGLPTLTSTNLAGQAVGASFDWPGTNLPNAIHPAGLSVVDMSVACPVAGLVGVIFNMLIEPALVGLLSKAHIQLQVTYTSPSGGRVTRHISKTLTDLLPTGEGLAAWDKKTFTSYVPCQIVEFLTEIAINTEIDVNVMLLSPNPLPTGSVTKIFYDPSIEFLEVA